MINLIIQYPVHPNEVFQVEQRVFEIKEIDGGYCIEVDQPDDWDALELELEAVHDILVVGTYNEDGSQYLWGNEVSRNHTPEKYRDALKPAIVQTGETTEDILDDEGNVVDQINYPILEEVPYDLDSAVQKQVARPPKHNPRQLT